MRLAAVLLSAALLAAGCASSGVEVSQQTVQSFQKGVATQSDILAKLGAPTTKASLSDGRSVWVYSFAAAKARPESFIPLVGAFVGGSDVHATTASFIFDQSGTLAEVHASETNTGSRLGTTTTAAPVQTDQPRVAQ